MSHVSWGLPAWWASVLTGTSLLLGFSILRHDWQKLERAQVDRVVGVWAEPTLRVGLPSRFTRFLAKG
jgi:hypothetical protein